MTRVPAFALTVLSSLMVCCAALAGPKIDKETCDQLKGEQSKFMDSGIVADIEKGPAWGKANLTAERLREVEHFILLDEQLKFGCRQVTLTTDALRAGEAALRLEANPNPVDPAAVSPAAGGATDAPGTEGQGASLPGQTLQERPAPKPAAKPKPEKGAAAAAPYRPKAADAYQPPPAARQAAP